MQIKKIIFIPLFLILCFNISECFAISKEDINRKNLESFDKRNLYDPTLFKYLSKNGITEFQYDRHVDEITTFKNGECEKWYAIESGTIFYDDILFSHPKIKSIYNDIKSSTKITKEDELRKLTKQKLIANTVELEKLLQESLDKYSDVNAIFKKSYKRDASTQELNWMKKLSTLKYAAYSGKLNGLSSSQINVINKKEGEILVGLELEEDGIYYRNSIANRNKIENLEIKYRRIYDDMSAVRSVIWSEYRRDINIVLTETEREKIYEKAITDITFNSNLALYETKLLLIEKGIISKNDTPTKPEVVPPINTDTSTTDKETNEIIKSPIETNDEYYKNIATLNPDISRILGALNISYAQFIKSVDTYLAKDKELCFKYQGYEFSTGLIDDNGKFSSEVARIFIELISEKLNGKALSGEYKTMLLVGDKVVVFDNLGLEDREVLLSYVKEQLKVLGIDVYYKNKTIK